MLKKIVINNFRCFKKFQLGSLKQLNIIVGDNNSGKTAFLEAVSIVCKPQLKHLFWLVKQRIENPDSIASIQEELDFLFNNADEEIKINIDLDDNVTYDFRIGNNLQPDKKHYGRTFFTIYANSSNKGVITQFINKDYLLSKYFSNLNSEIKSVASLPKKPDNFITFTHDDSYKAKQEHVFINTTCQFQDIFLTQLETLKFEDRETWKNDVLPFLQKIYPDLIGVEFGRNSRIIIETATGALPLSYMGDGFKKAFYLFLAVYCCKDGVLVIDELETGIHYENQLAVWQILLSASKKFNTQLFISTHSYEMLEYLQKAIENLPPDDKTHWQEQLSLYSLLKINNEPSVFEYSYAGFESFIENNREFR